ncbi:MAG TPA: pyrimidine 5'-nucleotidase, partial [Methylocella sp.]|nr:pyrimidine 5'-nucleotidase [Methylocella sp.]
IIPHQKGMTTVLVVPKPGQKVHREAFETAHEAAALHIDYFTSDLSQFLNGFAPPCLNSSGP